jgi:hypothetical protein
MNCYLSWFGCIYWKQFFLCVNHGFMCGSSGRLVALASIWLCIQTPIISTKCKSVNTLLWPLFLCLSVSVCLSLCVSPSLIQLRFNRRYYTNTMPQHSLISAWFNPLGLCHLVLILFPQLFVLQQYQPPFSSSYESSLLWPQGLSIDVLLAKKLST